MPGEHQQQQERRGSLLAVKFCILCIHRGSCVTSPAMKDSDFLHSSDVLHPRGVLSSFYTAFILLKKG